MTADFAQVLQAMGMGEQPPRALDDPAQQTVVDVRAEADRIASETAAKTRAEQQRAEQLSLAEREESLDWQRRLRQAEFERLDAQRRRQQIAGEIALLTHQTAELRARGWWRTGQGALIGMGIGFGVVLLVGAAVAHERHERRHDARKSN